MTNDESGNMYDELIGKIVIVRLFDVGTGKRDSYTARLIKVRGPKLKFTNHTGRIWIEDEENIRNIVVKDLEPEDEV